MTKHKTTGAMTVTTIQAGGEWNVWMNYEGGDNENAFLIGTAEIAAGQTREYALETAAALLHDALELVGEFQRDAT